jgi:8-hydroxy-5-deazaflavin:NADPH oxidoreductase
VPASIGPTVGGVALIGGTGRLGPGLALRLARAGVPVVVGSRDRERAEQRAVDIGRLLAAAGGGAAVRGAVNSDAAAAAEIAFITVPHEGQAALLPSLAGPLAGRVVVSTAVPVRFDPELGPVTVAVAEGSAAEQVAALLPRSRVVAGFHTVSSTHLDHLDRDLDEDVLISGDDGQAKGEVRRLAELVPGIRTVDVGRLISARITEQLTVLLLGVNRLTHRTTGVKLVGL